MIPAPLRHPLLATQNAFKALGRVLLAALKSKQVLASETTRMARITTCATCPHREDSFCGVCTCDIVTKASFQTETCPKDFWEQ